MKNRDHVFARGKGELAPRPDNDHGGVSGVTHEGMIDVNREQKESKIVLTRVILPLEFANERV